jgi:hypothetical protein
MNPNMLGFRLASTINGSAAPTKSASAKDKFIGSTGSHDGWHFDSDYWIGKFLRDAGSSYSSKVEEPTTMKFSSTFGVGMNKLAFGAFAAKALPYAGKMLMKAPGFIGNNLKNFAGAGLNLAGKTFGHAGMLGTGARLAGEGAAGLGARAAQLAPMRSAAQGAFSAMQPWQQTAVRGAGWLGSTMTGLNTSGAEIARHAVMDPALVHQGAQGAANQGADMMDNLSNADFPTRARLAMGLAFQPEMLQQYSQQLRHI